MPTSDNQRKVVPANAFSNVVLSGVAKDVPSSTPRDIILTGGKPRPNKPFMLDGYTSRPPKRLPSRLPPPGNMKLHLAIGNKIGRGRVARVFEATVDLDKSSPELASMALPPLVVKISRREDAKKLAREAYYYEEMECLQGSVIPRFYGLFEATIPPEVEFVPWVYDKFNPTTRRYDDSGSESEEEREDTSDDDSDDDDGGSFEDDNNDDDKSNADPDGDDDSEDYHSDSDDDDERNRDNDPPVVPRPTLVSILVLERVGGRMPIGQRLPPALLEELDEMYSDLAKLGVDHVDIRYFNILRAPEPLPDLPSLPSPFTQRTYNWRLVDFDNSFKTNRPLNMWFGYYHCVLDRLLANLPYGDIYEPWE
ncbi:unnamed protein product [Somion occarium]|uniref:Protein kinase domain-containing protein n=1 Tax=Somion occarium TaxID=3059160 RepID=A0ABP1DEQ5_9APHY